MKNKYILETYDRIINEIKNPKIVFENDFVAFLQSCNKKSYFVYKITFNQNNGRISYKIKQPVHNLHPQFEEINNETIEPDKGLASLVPSIVDELNLKIAATRLHWENKNGRTTLYMVSDIDIGSLTTEMRFFFYCYHSLQQENERIKKLNKETIFNFKSKERIEQYIHKKQYAIENLASRLIKDINPATTGDIYNYSNKCNKIDCLKVVYIYLEKLLRFIEKEYRTYLNINIQVPYRTILLKEYEITQKLTHVKNAMLGSTIDADLLQLAYEPLLKVATIKVQEKITYYEFNYCSDYIMAFYQHLDKHNITNEGITELLLDLNYNSVNFLKYITTKIQQDIENVEDLIQKIDLLYKNLKNYNQKQNNYFIKYKELLPPIIEQLTSWIEEEINYLAKKIKLDANHSVEVAKVGQHTKLQTSLSVAQLVYLFSLMQEAEIIKHKNQMDIFRFISENFKTKNADHISVDSLKVKFYNVETTTKQAVRDKIIELLTLSKR